MNTDTLGQSRAKSLGSRRNGCELHTVTVMAVYREIEKMGGIRWPKERLTPHMTFVPIFNMNTVLKRTHTGFHTYSQTQITLANEWSRTQTIRAQSSFPVFSQSLTVIISRWRPCRVIISRRALTSFLGRKNSKHSLLHWNFIEYLRRFGQMIWENGLTWLASDRVRDPTIDLYFSSRSFIIWWIANRKRSW